MKRKFIPVEEAFACWSKDPEYVAAYDTLEEEFALASSLIRARAEADGESVEEAIRQGREDVAAVRTYPAEEVFAEARKMYGLRG